jgi:hypothetical protein
MVWNPFAVRGYEEAEKQLKDGLAAVDRACRSAASGHAVLDVGETGWQLQTRK